MLARVVWAKLDVRKLSREEPIHLSTTFLFRPCDAQDFTHKVS